VALDPDDDVARRDVPTVDDPFKIDAADRHAHEIEAADHIAELRDLAARDRDLRHLGAPAKSGADRIEHGRVGHLDRDVIDERQRLGADADQIVDVHGDAIDADRVVFPHHVRDDGLRADAVRAQRNADAVDLDDIGVIADGQHDPAHAVLRPGLLYARDDAFEPRVGFRDVAAGRLVGFLARVARPVVRHSGFLSKDRVLPSPHRGGGKGRADRNPRPRGTAAGWAADLAVLEAWVGDLGRGRTPHASDKRLIKLRDLASTSTGTVFYTDMASVSASIGISAQREYRGRSLRRKHGSYHPIQVPGDE